MRADINAEVGRDGVRYMMMLVSLAALEQSASVPGRDVAALRRKLAAAHRAFALAHAALDAAWEIDARHDPIIQAGRALGVVLTKWHAGLYGAKWQHGTVLMVEKNGVHTVTMHSSINGRSRKLGAWKKRDNAIKALAKAARWGESS